MLERIQKSEVFNKYKKWIPLVAFLSGFVWDAITLGRAVTRTDLWVLSGYFALSTICLRILTSEYQGNHRDKVLTAFQFCQGALFSALSIFYFKSSGAWHNILLILFIAALMVLNEFYFDKLKRRGLWVGMHQIIGTMLLSFVIPHWVHSVNGFWVFVSCVLGFCLSAFVSHWGRHKKQSYLGVGALLFFAAWYFNFVPPVPLVLKDSFACTDRSANYTCQVNQLDWSDELMSSFTSNKVELNKGQKIVYMNSIFAPDKVEAKLEHRWYVIKENKWFKSDVIPLKLKRGGRLEGWRFYSEKQNWQAGRYKVETALKNGPVIGSYQFELHLSDQGLEWESKTLK
jgi:hypothetical protein